jgi:CheY-like chemotaxis protein
MMASLRIAVADDERDMRDYLQRVLQRLGHEVLGPVENGLQLVELCRIQLPDLIITDIRMPVMNGDDALRRIYAERPIPYIVISAFGAPEAIPGDLENGGDAIYLNKPVRKQDLERAIARLATQGVPPEGPPA